jgi:tryptophan synthase alpha chain
MSRISNLFESKLRNVLNVYCTAGYPAVDSAMDVMIALQENGADMIELGIPYSDPLADGPVIQASSNKALANGMTISRLFEQLKGFRDKIKVPLVLMGYLNPILQFGFEKFCRMANELGIDGLIIPDLPEYEFQKDYHGIIKQYKLDFIFLVTPETTEGRVKILDELSSGFLYAVSSSSITGGEKDFKAVEEYLIRLKAMNLKNPLLAGFGIKDRKSFEIVCRHVNGAIIGTAFIASLHGQADIKNSTAGFLKQFVN